MPLVDDCCAQCVHSGRGRGGAGGGGDKIWVPYLGGCEACERQVVRDGVDAHLKQQPRTTRVGRRSVRVIPSEASTGRDKGGTEGVHHGIGAA